MSLEPNHYVVDGITPSAVFEPQSDAEVADALAHARETGRGVIPVGGATSVQVGGIPHRYDIALSTRRLTGIVEYSPEDLTVVVRAGTPVTELQNELARHRQFLPLQPAFPDRATVGGALAAVTSSPWRGAYGTARDFTIGMRMALPSGQVARSGGKVVKNVAGYDLAKVFIGSYGSLGVITEVAFKIYPMPAVVRRLEIRMQDASSAWTCARAVAALGQGVLGVAIRITESGANDGTFGSDVIAMLGGSTASVSELTGSIRALSRRAPEVLDGNEGEAFLAEEAAQATYRISIPPRYLSDVVTSSTVPLTLAYPAIGFAFGHEPDIQAARITEIRERLRRCNGHLVLLNVPAGLKREVEVWGPPPAEMPLMRRVKDVFDPHRVMSPGRFVGGL